MSTIRRHGVAFHLIPTAGEHLWLEAIRESDGVVLASERFAGASDEELGAAVDEWFAQFVTRGITAFEIGVCRGCGSRQRLVPFGDEVPVPADYLVEWAFDLCFVCACRLEQGSPWMRRFLMEKFGSMTGEDH